MTTRCSNSWHVTYCFFKVLTERRSNSGRSGGCASRSNENIGGPPVTPLGDPSKRLPGNPKVAFIRIVAEGTIV